ncbi:MAG: hypothetical protein IPP79_21415 [Chitinophagaceae bacterium]|nr:hypothetical protein [Chitinophagaceae bacterium]
MQRGQKVDVGVFSFHHIFHEAIHAFYPACDKGLSGAIKKTCGFSQNYFAYEYQLKKTQKFFNPFTFFALIIAIYAAPSKTGN